MSEEELQQRLRKEVEKANKLPHKFEFITDTNPKVTVTLEPGQTDPYTFEWGGYYDSNGNPVIMEISIVQNHGLKPRADHLIGYTTDPNERGTIK